METNDGATNGRGYAICTAPRSGSNLLCQYLASTDVLGRPLEYFNWQGRRGNEDPTYPKDPAAQIHRILTRGATKNGIYGVKLFYYQHTETSATLDWRHALPNLSYIYLKRRDRLAQAISWARATQTSQYRSTHIRRAEPVYDAKLIQQRLDDLNQEYAEWLAFFSHWNIAPLTLVYEDFVCNPQLAVDAVARLLGVPSPPIAPERIDLAIQRDALNEDWRERFTRKGNLV